MFLMLRLLYRIVPVQFLGFQQDVADFWECTVAGSRELRAFAGCIGDVKCHCSVT